MLAVDFVKHWNHLSLHLLVAVGAANLEDGMCQFCFASCFTIRKYFQERITIQSLSIYRDAMGMNYPELLVCGNEGIGLVVSNITARIF